MQLGKSSLRYSLNRESNIHVQHMATLILMIAFPAKSEAGRLVMLISGNKNCWRSRSAVICIYRLCDWSEGSFPVRWEALKHSHTAVIYRCIDPHGIALGD